MSAHPRIVSVEVYQFQHDYHNHNAVVWTPGRNHISKKCAIRINTDVGISGEHYTYSVLEYAGAAHAAQMLIGRDPLQREALYDALKRPLRAQGRLGMSLIDNALWDLAGKYYSAPVWELLGGYRDRLPVYASTFVADTEPDGLSSPEAYADFAEQCLALGYKAYKFHTWWHGPIEREVALVRAVGKRVGDKMRLMLDAANAYETLGDAVQVGRALDEFNFFWYEDPFKDGGVAHEGHRLLRELIRTPLLQGELTRGLENKAGYITAHSTDFVRGDVEYDGITATMKLAHAAEALGLDIELHGGTWASRHCVAAIRNTNYFEWSMIHPKAIDEPFPFRKDGYIETPLDGIAPDGTCDVPQGVGLCQELDWDFIRANATFAKVFE